MMRIPLLVAVVISFQSGYCQTAFTVVPLGVHGGSTEDNLSSYLLTIKGRSEYIALDAGTLHAGIATAVRKGSLSGDPDSLLQKQVGGYLISHPHLDHVAGLIINSPEDAPKTIYGSAFCLSVIEDKYFSWKNWANFGDEGEQPRLKKYHFAVLAPGSTTRLGMTGLQAKPFLLSHGNPYQSTAFLVGTDSAAVLYLGDTGADSVEKSTQLQALWTAAAPLIRSGRLKGIFIETSFPNEQPVGKLFGHLTPRLLMQEMRSLAAIAGVTPLRSVPVIITHIKPGGGREQRVIDEVKAENSLGLRLIFPEQGVAFDL